MLEVMLPAPVAIPRGDLYVGVQSVGGNFPFAADTTAPRGRAFASSSVGTGSPGAGFTPLTVGAASANLLLRATINARFNTVGNHPPEISALSSNTVPAGASFPLTVFGSHFYPDSDNAAGLVYKSTIRVNGRDVQTTFLAASQLRANLTAGDLGNGAVARVTVYTQTPIGGLESNPLEINLSNAAPVPALTRLDPATVAIAGGAFRQKTIQLTGRNFTAEAVARVNGAARTSRQMSDTKLELTLTDADLAQAGALSITTANAATAVGGGGISNALNLTVAGCSYGLPGAGRAYPVSTTGETLDSILLDTADHCPWTITTSAPWIRLEGPTQGVGRAPIPFTVVNNPGGGGRTGTITVSTPGQGAQPFLINQPPGLAAVSSASYEPLSAVGAIATIFSSGLSATTQVATTNPLPTTLGGVRVVLQRGDTSYDCPLFFVSPTQINFQVSSPAPSEGSNNTFVLEASIRVLRDEALVASGVIRLVNVAPSLFTANATGQGVPAGVVLRVKADGTRVYEPLAEFDAATNQYVARALDLGPEGERVFLVLFGTGFRRRSSLENFFAVGDGIQLGVNYAGAQPDLVGVDQLNAELPRELTGRGEVPVQIYIDNRSSNRVTIRVK
ncbi:MAG: BACON domain-containing carbohydrate-binding protein [Blastocatellia bacterium]|nr:BACON domain-containing carbohydrate-binding protein [Blastocatellia bacterium]